MSLIEGAGEHWNSPIEVVERMATDNELTFERAVQDEIALVVSGKLTDYQISFTWMNEIEVLHLACAFEMKVPEPRTPEVQQLIVTINEQLWIGHFDVWMQSGMVMFRHALLLVGGGGLSGRQCEAMFGRGHGRRHVRDVRRGVMDPAAVQLFVARIAEYTHTQTRAGLI